MLGSKGMPCNLEAWIFHTACQRKAWRSIAIPDNVNSDATFCCLHWEPYDHLGGNKNPAENFPTIRICRIYGNNFTW